MNVESLKSELQQVLENDVILRKEFNGLKRSLSDYRNQLIMRDEDCKRLQVTIDVLNTKLVVMERDNNTYKGELNAFKELRGTINEQLRDKQAEIDQRLIEIQSLRDDLNSMAASYEATIDLLKTNSSAELERVKSEYSFQINELRTNTQYKESGIKEEYENMVAGLTNSWADREQSLMLTHEEEIIRLKDAHSSEINLLKSEFVQQLAHASSTGHEEIASLQLTHQLTLNAKEEEFTQKISALDEAYQQEINSLKVAIEEQKNALTSQYSSEIENLNNQLLTLEQKLQQENTQRIEELTNSHITNVNEIIAAYDARVVSVVNEYEEKLSNMLIHSNAQNSKLNEELSKLQLENELDSVKINELVEVLENKAAEISQLNSVLAEKEESLNFEIQKTDALIVEFDAFKQQASLGATEHVNELNQQIAALNLAHSDYVSELNTRIDDLNAELSNLGVLFESATNNVSELETTVEAKTIELQNAEIKINELSARIESFDNSFAEKDREIEEYKAGFESAVKEELKTSKLEYEKLLTENTNLIEEIDLAQDKVEAQEQEITLLKGELDEVRIQSIGKSEYFKETLANKNFEITNLEANNAALNQEILLLKKELDSLQEKHKSESSAQEEITLVQEKLQTSTNRIAEMQVEIDTLYTIITGLNDKVAGFEDEIKNYQSEIAELRTSSKVEEQEDFIGRLFKQIDELHDQRLALLDEKEQMATQLLKMNEVVGGLSQQVETERIDVSILNNHRKNVILANNSQEDSSRPQMKEQINDLVREIDKCIALLSA